MSGGSYNYICWKDPCEVDVSILRAMEKDLANEGYQDISNDIKAYADLIEIYKSNLETSHDKLEKIMHDFEWYQSNDTGKDSFDESVKSYREQK